MTTISERARNRAKYNTAVNPYRLLEECADTIDELVAALEATRYTMLRHGWAEGSICLDTIDAALARARKGGK